MNELEISNNMFEDIKHTDELGNEFWYSRELGKILEYSEYREFSPTIKKAIIACNKSNQIANNHFVQMGVMVNIGLSAKREVKDYKLSRYTSYLIVQNADSSKPIVALGQTYFLFHSRRQELSEKDYNILTEEEKRFYQRDLTKKGNHSLNQTAAFAGVKNFDRFHNVGYRGLYNGETASDIAKRKKLRYGEDILDNMGSDELIANLFRISQTEQKLRKDNIQTEKEANITYRV